MTAPAPTELLKLADEMQSLQYPEFGECLSLDAYNKILFALRQAASVERAEVAGEAVAWRYRAKDQAEHRAWAYTHRRRPKEMDGWEVEDLYASPPRSEGVRASEVQSEETTIPGSENMDARFAWLEAKAIDMGYMLVPEPAHPDSPHVQESVDPAVWIKGLLDLYFAPWGAAKAARFEEMTGDKPFDPEIVLRLIHDKLNGSELPSADGGPAA